MSQDETTSQDYGRCYYNEAHLGGYDDYTWDNERWRSFFMSVADRLIGSMNPRTVLDVGCARGLLVQALMVQGVDARGMDISEHAIESAHEDVRDRLVVASATEPIEGRYDLVSCIEVLEHLSPGDAQTAMDRITQVTDRILFSSSPGDHDEPTHVNTHPTDQWVAWFAERGFYRRTDLDMGMIAPWTLVLERGEPTMRELTQRYEQLYGRTRTEMLEKRSALLEAHRRIQTLHDQLEDGSDDAESLDLLQAEVDRLRAEHDRMHAEVVQARHDILVQRDHVIGIEAQNGRLQRDLALVTLELQKARRRLTALAKRRDELTSKLQAARQRLDRNRRRLAELEAVPQPASLPRRVARKVRGAMR